MQIYPHDYAMSLKNYDAGQHSLYAGNPTGPYRMIDTGNTRLAYIFGKGTGNTVDVSASLRGGHLQIKGENGHYGTQWAGALAADAELGDWTLQGQAVLYKYNVPAGMGVSRQSVLMEDYGFPTARLPAAGLMLTVNVAKTFNFKHLGPINSVQPFVDFGYLKSRVGHFDDSPSVTAANGGAPYRMGNIMSVTPGAITTVGPFVLWTEVVLGKNDELRFIGPYGTGSSDVVGFYNNDNQWHARYNIEAAFYFGGNVN